MHNNDDFIILDYDVHRQCRAIADSTMASLCSLADSLGLSRNDIISGFADIFDFMTDSIDYDSKKEVFNCDDEGGIKT